MYALRIYMLVLILNQILAQIIIANYTKNCTYDNHPKAPEVYYINLKKSHRRRQVIQQLLSTMQLRYFRVEAVSSSSIYVPPDLVRPLHNSALSFADVCKYWTKEKIDNSTQAMQVTNKTHLVSGICSIGILWTELFCTMSHLFAIYNAVHSTTAKSNYAIIMEDDIHIPISTDFNALAESAPSDFGIVQLLSVNSGKVSELWELYTKQHTLWSKHNDAHFWSTGIYLINRERMRPIIDAIVRIDPVYPHIMQYTLIATKPRYRKYKLPPECTVTATATKPSICIQSHDIVADRYIYAMNTTYMSCLPIAYVQTGFKTTV